MKEMSTKVSQVYCINCREKCSARLKVYIPSSKPVLVVWDCGAYLEEETRRLEKARKDVTPQDIMELVGVYYGITYAQIMSASKQRTIVRARHTAMLACKELLGLPIDQIGYYFNRDVSGVRYALIGIVQDARAVDIVERLRETT